MSTLVERIWIGYQTSLFRMPLYHHRGSVPHVPQSQAWISEGDSTLQLSEERERLQRRTCCDIAHGNSSASVEVLLGGLPVQEEP